ncbi:MAG: glutamate synthase large subunit [Acidobacteriota bacterium]
MNDRARSEKRAGLYDPAFEHDACGIGFVADRAGRASAEVLPLALQALSRMAHRGAVDADGRTGDGAGVTTQIPHALLTDELARRSTPLPEAGRHAVGLLFLPAREDERRVCCDSVDDTLRAFGLPLRGWRRVPTREEVLGPRARASCPAIRHLIVGRPEGLSDEGYEGLLFLARKEMERRLRRFSPERFCVVSLSHRTLVYKALVRGVDLADFYPDLRHPLFATAFALFHQRYSTNTLPSWARTQPFRLLAHNGEINTISGNRAHMRAREAAIAAGGSSEWKALLPLLQDATSDSASLDNAAELLMRTGQSLLHAIAMLLPPAWENDAELAPDARAFFEYQAGRMEPWDGPALVLFTDGVTVGAATDRNGLRPARYVETRDGLFVLASEAGVVDVAEENVLRRGRLSPGDLLALDLRERVVLERTAIHARLAAGKPYRQWLEKNARRVSPTAHRGQAAAGDVRRSENVRVLKSFGYTREEMELVLGPMFREGREPVGSMGDDTPLAAFSAKPRPLFSYFKQRFAQVTNPPIDPLRESVVMSLATPLGPEGELWTEQPGHAARVWIESPVLCPEEMESVAGGARGGSVGRVALRFRVAEGAAGFRRRLDEAVSESIRAVEDGASFVQLSDRGVDGEHAALPTLLAVAAAHRGLVERGLRPRASLLVETGDARDDHQIACLLAFGADAVCPYLALEQVRAAGSESTAAERSALYLSALAKGILKILSKMGISTARSYQGAGLFEVIGLSSEVARAYFSVSRSPIEGVGLPEIAEEVLGRHALAFGPAARDVLEEGGFHRYRRDGEAHAFSPELVRTLHTAIGSGQAVDFGTYASLVRRRDPVVVRDLLEFAPARAVPLEDVEPVEAIFRRFATAAMSIGALSPEAHETLAIAMNRIGGRSNSGEGGTDPVHHWALLHSGDSANDRIKQVASARFGVTADYLMSADELQIKMAQGSKPGEGGQLPGHKVAPHIARLRHSPEGVTLISPPPHHDIYSIEDLAQLIYDLKSVNPSARIGVKLVSSAGIGTIAAGVVKAFADAIQISGHDGGTGASPLGSIKNAGAPWEIGLAEVQQVLVAADLRRRVRIQVDGGLKTGRDVVIAALLGAEEFGFGSAALVSAGCVMARQCHSNTCPVGIATQREDLRRRFRGTPEMVIRFFAAVAQEVREILARIGCRSLEEAIGRVELLQSRVPPGRFKISAVDLSRIVPGPSLPGGPRRCLQASNDPPATGAGLDERVLSRLRWESGGPAPVALDFDITNADRAVGARIAGELAGRLRGRRLPPGLVTLRYHGSAGQSFGAFCVDGMRMALHGEANDHVGKGMSGGEIVLAPRRSFPRPPAEPVIAGNAILYGATGGRLFAAGRVGERFAVRNSGALAVVEGAGDHACEYMTAGSVAILGEIGRNFGAGMSGGVAYILDPDARFRRRCNAELVASARSLSPADGERLKRMIQWHRDATGSTRAAGVLENWAAFLLLFWKVAPGQSVRPASPSLVRSRPRPAAQAGQRPAASAS